MILAAVYLGGITLLSGISFAFYGWDKRQAVLGRRRVPEQTLHLIDLAGGWPGGLLGQRYFRHKTKKLSFQIRFWLAVALHVAVVGVIGYQNLSSIAGS